MSDSDKSNSSQPEASHAGACPFCGAPLPAVIGACPSCGIDERGADLATFIPPRGPLAKLAAWLLLAIIFSTLAVMIYGTLLNAAPRPTAP